MATKYFSLLLVLVMCLSCKNTQEQNTEPITDEVVEQEPAKVAIPTLDHVEFALDEKTERVIENWQEYNELADVVANVKEGDLSYFKDNDSLIDTLFKNLKAKSPDTINTPSVAARMVALETKFRKLGSFSNLSTTNPEELDATIKEFLLSFSHLNLQMNKKMEDDSQNIVKP